MTYSTKVTTVTVVQFRTETTGADGKVYGWNKTFQKSHAAAKFWASNKILEWETSCIKKYGRLNFYNHPGYLEERDKRINKYTRRSLPVFKKILGK